MDSVARGTLINLATRTLSVLLVLAITAIAARLGTAQQGAFALFTSVESALLALLSGFGIALARRVSHHGEQPRALVAATVLACVGLGVLASAALSALSAFGPPAYHAVWLLALVAPLLLIAPNLAGLWLGEGRMLPMARLTLAAPTLTLAALAGLWLLRAAGDGAALFQVLAAWALAKAAVALGVLGVLWRGRRLARPDFGALRRELPFIATIGLSNLIGIMNYRVGIFLVERFLGLAATGIYSIAVVVAELLWFVSSSLTQAVYGRIGTPDRAQAARTTLRAVHLSLLALLAVAPFVWAAAALLLPRVLGPDYAQSVPLVALLLPGVLAFGGASALSAYFTNHAGQPRVPAQVAALSLAINAGLSLLLIPSLGMNGAALAASVSYGLTVALLLQRFRLHAGLSWRQVLVPEGALLRQDGLALWRALRRVGAARRPVAVAKVAESVKGER